MLDNRYAFKQDFTPLLNYFYIKAFLITIKNPQANSPLERVHQVILNMLATKDISNKVFDCIYTWGDTLSSIAWAIRAYYCRTIQATLCQTVFVRYMILNLVAVVYWKFITSGKQKHVIIDNVR